MRHRVLPGRRPSAIHRAIRSIHRRARGAPYPLLREGAKQSRRYPRPRDGPDVRPGQLPLGDSRLPSGDGDGAGDVNGRACRAGGLPGWPPATGNHCLKGLPVHRGVLFAGCPGQGGRHAASREFPGRIFHALALEAFLKRYKPERVPDRVWTIRLVSRSPRCISWLREAGLMDCSHGEST